MPEVSGLSPNATFPPSLGSPVGPTASLRVSGAGAFELAVFLDLVVSGSSSAGSSHGCFGAGVVVVVLVAIALVLRCVVVRDDTIVSRMVHYAGDKKKTGGGEAPVCGHLRCAPVKRRRQSTLLPSSSSSNTSQTLPHLNRIKGTRYAWAGNHLSLARNFLLSERLPRRSSCGTVEGAGGSPLPFTPRTTSAQSPPPRTPPPTSTRWQPIPPPTRSRLLPRFAPPDRSRGRYRPKLRHVHGSAPRNSSRPR